jgi:hypothetical protein
MSNLEFVSASSLIEFFNLYPVADATGSSCTDLRLIRTDQRALQAGGRHIPYRGRQATVKFHSNNKAGGRYKRTCLPPTPSVSRRTLMAKKPRREVERWATLNF